VGRMPAVPPGTPGVGTTPADPPPGGSTNPGTLVAVGMLTKLPNGGGVGVAVGVTVGTNGTGVTPARGVGVIVGVGVGVIVGTAAGVAVGVGVGVGVVVGVLVGRGVGVGDFSSLPESSSAVPDPVHLGSDGSFLQASLVGVVPVHFGLVGSFLQASVRDSDPLSPPDVPELPAHFRSFGFVRQKVLRSFSSPESVESSPPAISESSLSVHLISLGFSRQNSSRAAISSSGLR